MSLIPKSLVPQSLNDFWPISLASCLYKIMAKVSSKRLKKVLEGILISSKVLFWKEDTYFIVFL